MARPRKNVDPRNSRRQSPDGGGKRVVLYARVSAREQEKEGFSIPAQMKLLRAHADAQGMTVAAEHVDVETARKTGRTEFEALPDQLTVYRGCYTFNKWGFSWSLDRDVAAGFPFLHRYRQDDQALLVRATVAKNDIVALKHDRQEAEVICWRPKHVSTSKLRS